MLEISGMKISTTTTCTLMITIREHKNSPEGASGIPLLPNIYAPAPLAIVAGGGVAVTPDQSCAKSAWSLI